MNDVGVLELTEIDPRLDFEPSCDWGAECGHPARWIATWPCCARQMLFCDEHRRVAIEFLASSVRRHIPCGTWPVDHLIWEPL